MKKIPLTLFVSIFFFGTTHLKAQTYSFAFSQFTSPYTPLVGGTSVYGSTVWNSGSISNVPFGFNFNFMGFNETTLDMIPGVVAWPPALDSMGVYTFYAALRDTGGAASQSPVTYSTTGTAGNRILKIDVAAAGFENEFSAFGQFYSTVNFQSWFYEADNSIEVHVGPSTVVYPLVCYLDSASPGPSVGPIVLNTAQSSVLYSLALSGNPAAPTQTVYVAQSFPPVALNGTPSSGTVYRFAQVISGINEQEQVFSTVGIFPNPANENSTLMYSVKNSGDVQVVVTDMQGRIVLNESEGIQMVGAHQLELNTADFANGIYFVTLVSGEQKITQKLSVAH